MLKRIFIFVIILTLGVFAYLIYLTSQNTHYLTITPNETDIKTNNQNVALMQKAVKIPDNSKNPFNDPKTLNLPENAEIYVYASGLVKPRSLDFDQNGNMFVTDTNFFANKENGGEVILIKNNSKDYFSDEKITVDQNLRNPHGIDFYNGDLYVGEEHQIIVYRNITEYGKYDRKEVLVENLPRGTTFSTGSGHVTRTVKVGPDKKLYVSIGSSCNVCEESDPRRAAIVRYNLDGTNEEIVATGLRNTVGFTFVPNQENTQIWGVDNGRDRIGDDLPPEELNIININGTNQNFGWPYCYGKQIPNPEFPDRETHCKENTIGPAKELQAHSAPLGIVKIDTTKFPKYEDMDTLITYHGSWNRTTPTGYKVVGINSQDLSKPVTNFVTGWLNEDGSVWGRPVDVAFDKNGDLFITDDYAGVIYKVVYTGVE